MEKNLSIVPEKKNGVNVRKKYELTFLPLINSQTRKSSSHPTEINGGGRERERERERRLRREAISSPLPTFCDDVCSTTMFLPIEFSTSILSSSTTSLRRRRHLNHRVPQRPCCDDDGSSQVVTIFYFGLVKKFKFGKH